MQPNHGLALFSSIPRHVGLYARQDGGGFYIAGGVSAANVSVSNAMAAAGVRLSHLCSQAHTTKCGKKKKKKKKTQHPGYPRGVYPAHGISVACSCKCDARAAMSS